MIHPSDQPTSEQPIEVVDSNPPVAPGKPRASWLWRVSVCATLLLASLVRLSSPTSHFREGRLVAADADAAMHTRRALAWVQDFPWPAIHDPFLGFPEGAPFPWAPGWDALLGAFAWVMGGFSTESFGFQLGLALLPLLVGVLSVGLVMEGARRLWTPRAGWVAGLSLALTPQHVAATQFARPDHNAAEGLLLLALTLALCHKRPRPAVIAVWVALCGSLWVGGFLYAGLAVGASVGAALLLPDAGKEAALASCKGLALGALLLAPVAGLNGLAAGRPLDYAWLSFFHPALLAVLAGVGVWVLRRRLGLGLVLLLAILALLGPTREGLQDWLVREDPWLATVTEMQPLLTGPPWHPGSWEFAWRFLGLGYLLLPAALFVLGRRAHRQSRPEHLLVVLITAALFALSLLQNRFGWTLAPLLGLCLGGLLANLRFSPALVLLFFARGPAEADAAWLAPKTRQNQMPWRFEAYHWLAQTPPVDPRAPEWGVAGQWEHGHWIAVLGERPEHIGHFGTYAGGIERYRETQTMYRGSTEDLLAMMDRDRLRFLVVAVSEVPGDSAPLSRLRHGGSAGDNLPSVNGLLPRFAASRSDMAISGDLPGAWVYERVPGVTLDGKALPEAPVQLSIAFQWRGESRVWTTRTQADALGDWSLQSPVWTGSDGDLPTAPAATLTLGEHEVDLIVQERDVREGRRLWVPGPWDTTDN